MNALLFRLKQYWTGLKVLSFDKSKIDKLVFVLVVCIWVASIAGYLYWGRQW